MSVRTWFTGGELRLTEAVLCPEPPDIVRSRLIEAVEAVDEPFTLVSKLSGGGIVTRVLRAPQTRRPLFGRVEAPCLRIALVANQGDGSPFQPIAGVTIEEREGGCSVRMELAPHPGARTFSAFFAFGGGLLGLASLGIGADRPLLAVCGAVFSFLLVAFPGFRARYGFDRGCQQLCARLHEVLGVDAEVPA